MPSTYQTVVRVPERGFNQSKQQHLIEPSSCWDLLNLHQVNGRLEQTPWLYNFQSLTKLTGETTDTPTRLLRLVTNTAGTLKYLAINETNPRYIDVANYATQTLIPVVLQTAKPANATLTGECLLYGINATDFAASGDTIDVNIVTGTTFRWRRNGGAWSASLTIQQDTAIGANGLHVSFQGQGDVTDFTGFTAGDTWTWTRTTMPSPTSPASTQYFSYSSDMFGTDVYVGGVGRNIMRVRNDFMTSVGYSRVYGKHVAVFFGHLFVSQYAQAQTSISDPYVATSTPFTLGWSHLNNPDQFYSTLINEADAKVLPQQQFSDLASLGITGLAPWRSLLFIFMSDAIWNFQYVGLPNVFQATALNSNIGSIFQSGVVRTPQAIYFIGRNDFYKIEDFEPVPIGVKVRNKFYSEICEITDANFQRTFGFYNTLSKEIVWTYWVKISAGNYQVRQVVYNEQTDDWHFRNMPCAYSTYSDPWCGAPLYNTYGLAVYGYTQKLYAEQAAGVTSGALEDTYSSGAKAFTQPYFTTPYMNYGDYFHIKQSSSMYIDAAWAAGGYITVSRDAKNYIGNAVTNYVAVGQNWTQTLTDQRLSLPRDPYRSIAYKFTFATADGTPVYGANFNLYQEFFLGPNQQIEK